MNITKKVENLAKASPFIWTTTNLNLPKGMYWDFRYRKWQIPILNERARSTVIMKPAQVGMSTIYLCKMLYLAYHIPMRVAYVLPRDKDYQDMVSTRADPIINSSEVLLSEIKGSDSMARKQLGESFIHFLASSTEPRMLDIDCLIIDETDLSNQEYLDLYSARLFASRYKLYHNLSTPKFPDTGVDKLLKESTWNIWNVKCPFCGKWIPFTEDWQSNLKITKHRIYYGGNCCDMSKDIGLTRNQIADGQWVESFSNRDLVGYQVIRTMDAMIEASELHTMWKTTRLEKNFYNSGLGLPYVADSVNLDIAAVLKHCLDSDVKKESTGKLNKKYHIGIDQGNMLHCVVLKESGDNKLDLVWAGTFDESRGDPFNQAASILNNYNLHHLMVDLLPNTHSAKNLVTKARKGSLANFQFVLGTKSEIYEDSKTTANLTIIQKHEALDELVSNWILKGKIRFYSDGNNEADKDIREVAQHISSLKRTVQTRSRMGLGEQSHIVWESSGADHYSMCLVYALISYFSNKKKSEREFRWALLG